MSLKDTLNLPDPEFTIPMRANLPELEPKIQQKWAEMGIYEAIQKARKDAPTYVLHDGPPYTNGPIHIGTALNKILKDFVVKSQSLMGKRAPYVPGYDNHGLPIEQAVNKRFAEKKEKPGLVEFRQACREHAEQYIEVQNQQFQRLGVFGAWDRYYSSLEAPYEAEIIRVFNRLVTNGYVYRGLRPVLWSPTAQTALADTEIIYKDHTSKAIYVRFPLLNDVKGVFAGLSNVFAVIWTTTPWTIPANLAVAFHPDFEYEVVRVGDVHYVLLGDRVGATMEACGFGSYETVKRFKGAEVERVEVKHPVYDRPSLAVLATYVTTEDGTGVVHTAPGHGRDDFYTGQRYGLPVLCPVNERGILTEEAGEFAGVSYKDCDVVVVDRLRELGNLLHVSDFQHSYPHAERDEKPVIFRATEQWFIGIDAPFHLDPSMTLRQKMMLEIEDVKWFPQSGYKRLRGMIENRPDWCISRQRPWGVGIPIFYGAESGEPVMDSVAIEAVAAFVEKHGSDAWYSAPPSDILPKGYKHPKTGETEFRKEVDVFDVWFDSGCTSQCVLEGKVEPRWKEELPADMYLEGSDQHRGWFNVSLIIGVACTGSAPYREVMTHGWVLDDKGMKQSKRLGNVVDPVVVCNKYGADILRLWAAKVDYNEDMPCSDKLLEATGEHYRRIRNTLRFLLANLYDYEGFDGELEKIDQWAIEESTLLVSGCLTAYARYDFGKVFRDVHDFCDRKMSAFYLDAIKDRVYCDGKDWRERRSAQKACHEILVRLTKLVSPILMHTAEEVYELIPHYGRKPSVHLDTLAAQSRTEWLRASTLHQAVNMILTLRDFMAVQLEGWKSNSGVKDSQDVDVVLNCPNEFFESLKPFKHDLANFFRVASMTVQEGELSVAFEQSTYLKCERSRVRRPDVALVDWNGEKLPLSERDRRALGIA